MSSGRELDARVSAEEPGQSSAETFEQAGQLEGFTLALALVDAVPVLEFCVSMGVLAAGSGNIAFAVGALLCVLAGIGKVVWKLIIALRGKDVTLLSAQFRYLMPAGMLIMVVAMALGSGLAGIVAFARRMVEFPVVVFLGLTIAAYVAMAIMGRVLDKRNARHNWIEQLTNIFGMTMLMALVLLCV